MRRLLQLSMKGINYRRMGPAGWFALKKSTAKLKLLTALPSHHRVRLIKHILSFGSKSGLGQDLFVLSTLNFKRSGYFVEFGGSNGISNSNSFILEKRYAWSGIVAEPAKCWHDSLARNRACEIDYDCVWRMSGEWLPFEEYDNGELSTIGSYSDSDSHRAVRVNPRSYPVRTVSLEDLLRKHRAPRVIDYLSIDTEGSEFEILNSFDFGAFDIRIITCEHNYTAGREPVRQLLEKSGYRRRLCEMSRYDDWFVKSDY